jgi:hypothetical protein
VRIGLISFRKRKLEIVGMEMEILRETKERNNRKMVKIIRKLKNK